MTCLFTIVHRLSDLLIYSDIVQLPQVVPLAPKYGDSLGHVVVICRIHGQDQLTIGNKKKNIYISF